MIVQTVSFEQANAHQNETWYTLLCRITECENHCISANSLDSHYHHLGELLKGAIDGVIANVSIAECLLYMPTSELAALDELNELLVDEYNCECTVVGIELTEYLAFMNRLRLLGMNENHFSVWSEFDAERMATDNLLIALQGAEPPLGSIDRVLDTFAVVKSWKALRDCDKTTLQLYTYRKKAG
jgi:hypothetical protein